MKHLNQKASSIDQDIADLVSNLVRIDIQVKRLNVIHDDWSLSDRGIITYSDSGYMNKELDASAKYGYIADNWYIIEDMHDHFYWFFYMNYADERTRELINLSPK